MFQDTGERLRFWHIHGTGIDVVTVDEHKGQALGTSIIIYYSTGDISNSLGTLLGFALFLQRRAQGVTTMDAFDPRKQIQHLTPYEHLKRCLRYCTVHYKRNIKKIEVKKGANAAIINLMYSLCTPEVLPDLDARLQRIQTEGDDDVKSEWGVVYELALRR